MKKLIEGLIRFKNEIYPRHRDLFQELASSQSPEVMLIACSDSRVVPGVALQAAPGDLFVCRNAGNIVPPYGEHTGGVSATIEYAVQVLKVKHIIVCGHSDCGAMKAAIDPASVSDLPAVSKWLQQAKPALDVVRAMSDGLDDQAKLERLIEENVRAQLDHLATHPCVAAKTRAGALRLHGWIYDIPHGEFHVFDAHQGRFVPLDSMVHALLATEPAVNA